jgi:hypothetical protein
MDCTLDILHMICNLYNMFLVSFFGGLATALLDRLLHNIIFLMDGFRTCPHASMRKKLLLSNFKLKMLSWKTYWAAFWVCFVLLVTFSCDLK